MVALKLESFLAPLSPRTRSRNAVVALKLERHREAGRRIYGSRNAVVALKPASKALIWAERTRKQERRGGIETAIIRLPQPVFIL